MTGLLLFLSIFGVVALVLYFIKARKDNVFYKAQIISLSVVVFLAISGFIAIAVHNENVRLEEVRKVQAREELAQKSQDLYARACALLENNELDEAERVGNELFEINPDFEDAQALRNNINDGKKARAHIESAKERLALNDVWGAYEDFNIAKEANPTVESTEIELIEEIKEMKVSFYIDEAAKYFRNSDIDAADNAINAAIDIDNNIEQTQEKLVKQIRDRKFQIFSSSCKSYSYKTLKIDFQKLEDKRIYQRGKIIEIKETDGKQRILVGVTNTGKIWVDNVAVYYDGALDIGEGDIVKIYGTIMPDLYENEGELEAALPVINAKYVIS